MGLVMPRPKRSVESEVTIIDGVKLVWHLHREQQWCSADRWKGLCIQVQAADGVHRSLLLEYRTVKNQKTHLDRVTWSTGPRIHGSKVEAHIKKAVAAGWDPLSRGKPFAYQIEELPG